MNRARVEQQVRPLLASRWSNWVLGALIALISWPLVGLQPTVGIDPSWGIGLYMATAHGLNFGTQVVYTYGPLGFLVGPNLAVVWLARIAFVWTALVHVGFCVAMLYATRRALGILIAAPLTLFAAIMPQSDPVLIPALIFSVALIFGEWSPRERKWIALGWGAVTAVELLSSLRAGPTLLVILIVALLAAPERRRTLSLYFGGLVGVFVFCWFATGQGVGNFGDYVINTASVVEGFSASMARVEVGYWWQSTSMFVAGGALLVLFLFAAKRLDDNWRRLALLVTVGAVTFLFFKHAVVQESPGSVAALIPAFLTLAFALAPYANRIAVVGTLATLVTVTLLTLQYDPYATFNFGAKTSFFVEQAGQIAIPGRAGKLQGEAKELMRDYYKLTPAELALLKGRTVYAGTWETGAIWAYDLDWDPLPIFQQYTAYTPRLDRLNAAKLEGSSAPERILWQNVAHFIPGAFPPGALDNRFPAWESPEQMVQMFCRYRVEHWDPAWAILRDSPDRCGPEREIETVTAGYDQPVPIPKVGPKEAVVLRVHGLAVEGKEKLLTLLYRAGQRRVFFTEGLYAVVGETAADGLLLSVPEWADYPGEYALSSKSETVAFDKQGGHLSGVTANSTVTLTFYALPVEAPATLAP